MKILLVASAGGHLAQLVSLKSWWSRYDRHWVTFNQRDAVFALDGEPVSWAHYPVTRNIPNAVRNLGLAVKVLRRERPDVIVTTGAGVSLPFFVIARFMRIRTVYIEVFDRIGSATMTGRLSYPLSDAMCGQWEEQNKLYPEAVLIGPTL
jgi:beta-1,4-N-acetylglucosaminyltransferase